MNRALAVVTVLSLFVAGIAIGALGMHIHHDRQIRHPDGPPGSGNGFVARRLHRLLDLSAEQMERIETILQQSHEKAMELRHDLHPRVMTIMDRAHEEIAEILDPEQQEAFKQLLQDNRRRAERFFLGSPHGRGRHGPWGGRGRRPWGGPGRGPRHSPGASADEAAPDAPPADQPGDPDQD